MTRELIVYAASLGVAFLVMGIAVRLMFPPTRHDDAIDSALAELRRITDTEGRMIRRSAERRTSETKPTPTEGGTNP